MGLLSESSSREKKTGLIYALLAVLFVLFYLVFFPRTLPPEFTLVPSDARVLNEMKADRLSSGGSFFILGNWEGYWGGDGQVERVQAKRPQSTAWGEQIAWYDGAKNQVAVEGIQGPLFTLPGEQYPYWAKGRLFTFEENRLGLKAYTPQGKILWSKHFSSLVTSLDATAKLTVVGTLDGRVQVFGTKGESVGGFQPGGSRLPVIYNVSVAPRDSAILVLAGVDPKRFLVLERGGSEFRPVFHKPLKENHPWPTPLGFLNSGSLAYYETEVGLAFLDPRNPEKEVVVPTQGNPIAMESLPGGRLVAFVQKNGDKTDLRVATQEGASVLKLPFSSQDVLLQRQGNFLFLGVDQTLLRLEVLIQ
jgi:hypothetical protein